AVWTSRWFPQVTQKREAASLRWPHRVQYTRALPRGRRQRRSNAKRRPRPTRTAPVGPSRAAMPTNAMRSFMPSGISPEAWHHFASEELHGAAHLVLGEAAEVHPAHHLAHTHIAHDLDVPRHRVGRAEGKRLGHQAFPGDLRKALGHGAECRLERGVRLFEAI